MRKFKLTSIFALIFLVFLLTLVTLKIPALESLELKTLDWRFAWRGPESVADVPIVIVPINDQSFESLPARWPWPRSYYAHVVENLTRAGARVIGLDLILDIPDPYGPEKDRALANAIKRSGKVVLTGKLEEHTLLGQVQSYVFEVTPLPVLLQADSSWGVVGIQSSKDGIYRQYFVAQKGQERWLPSFAIQVIKKFKNYPSNVKIQPIQGGFRLGDLNIPLYDKVSMLINFAGPAGTFPYYSFDSVIDDETFQLKEDFDLDYFDTDLLPDSVFKDKIVLIGSTVSEQHDNFPTPFLEYRDSEGNVKKAEMPGVEIHANAIRTILTGKYYRQLDFWYRLSILLFLIIFIQFTSLRLSTLWSTIFTLGTIIIYSLLQFYLFAHHYLVLQMVAPTIAIFLSFVSNNLYQYVLTQREKQMIMGAFQQYVPEKVVKELLAHPEKLSLGGEERFITVLFTDVADFTSISEALTPRLLVNLINEYLTEMTDIILKYNGIIDKYEGDAIMAEFGAPVDIEDHALKACLAALDMQKRLRQLAHKWNRQNKPILTCRAGINSGNMIVGNMGSNKVFDYTAIGDEVNLASRLEGANKIFQTNIMISESTYQLVKDHLLTRPLDLIRVKGRKKPVQVFEVIGSTNDKLEEGLKNILSVYVNGIRYFRQRQWEQAEECFQYCLRLRPNDGPSNLYLKRVREYAKTPPPPEWDGVFTLQTK